MGACDLGDPNGQRIEQWDVVEFGDQYSGVKRGQDDRNDCANGLVQLFNLILEWSGNVIVKEVKVIRNLALGQKSSEANLKLVLGPEVNLI
jgi:hypothetical protein